MQIAILVNITKIDAFLLYGVYPRYFLLEVSLKINKIQLRHKVWFYADCKRTLEYKADSFSSLEVKQKLVFMRKLCFSHKCGTKNL